jgi:F-type H+-transporting ATPase subunit b
MKRFLYKPILNAIAEREKRIAAELADAAQKKADAQKESDEYKRKNEDFERQRDALWAKTTLEAGAERQRLLDEAGKAADVLSAKRLENLRNEEKSFRQTLSRMAEREVFSIARKALADLAGTSLEERLAGVFVRRLGEMDGPAKEIFAGAIKTATAPAVLRSAFDMPGNQRAAIQKALGETFPGSIAPKFETFQDLVGGIELTANGQKLSWNIADYLKTLEKGVDDLLKQKEKAKASPELTAKIAKRAYEIYEQRGHRSDSADQDWSQAEQEIRKGDAKPAPKPEIKTEPKPDAVTEPKPGVKAGSKPEVIAETKPEDKPEPKQGASAEDKSGPKPELKPESKAEPKPEVVAEPKPGVKAEANTEVGTEPKPEAESEPKAVAKAGPDLMEREPPKRAS